MIQPSWRLHDRAAIQAGLGDFAARISALHAGAFDQDGAWPAARIARRLEETDWLGFLVDEAGDEAGGDFGYAIYQAPAELLHGARLLWESSIGLLPAARGAGGSRAVLDLVLDRLGRSSIGWIGGRTQNPVIVRRYARMGRLFPFDESYASRRGREVLAFVRGHIAELRKVTTIDEELGICRGAYHGRQIASVPAGVELPRKAREALERVAFRPEAGDAIILVALLCQQDPGCAPVTSPAAAGP